MKNIKKLLAQQKSEILPDDKIKDNIKKELGFEQKQTSLVYAHNGKQKSSSTQFKMILCSFAVIVVLFLGIFIPVFLNKDIDTGNPKIYNKFAQVVNADTFYAYSVASVGALLSSNSVHTSSFSSTSQYNFSATMSATYSTQRQQNELNSAQKETLDKYMSLLENLLSESKIENSITNGELNYQFTMIVNYSNLNGEKNSYKMIFNKTLIDEDVEDFEVEQNYAIDGILLIENEEYPVEGLYKIETENGESESEMFFKAFTNTKKSSYIEVQQTFESEIEDGKQELEQEFIYSLYSEGLLVEQNTIGYEAEGNELSLRMSIKKGEIINNLIFDAESKEGKLLVHVTGNMSNENVNFYIQFQDGKYNYI